MTNDEKRIRELAHQIWESEGKPEGQSERHWEMACKLLQSEQQGELQPSPTKARKPRTKKAASELPAEDETQLKKPALLGKPAGAEKPVKTPRQPASTAAKTTKAGKPAAKRSKE